MIYPRNLVFLFVLWFLLPFLRLSWLHNQEFWHKLHRVPLSSPSRATHLYMKHKHYCCKSCQYTFMWHPGWLHPPLRITQLLYINIYLSLMTMQSLKTVAKVRARKVRFCCYDIHNDFVPVTDKSFPPLESIMSTIYSISSTLYL